MKITLLESLFNKELNATLLKKGSNTGVFCEYCAIFKITCFEESLRTDLSIRCYFDTINIKQSGLDTLILSKFLFQNENIKIISKIVDLKKKIQF